MIIQRTRRQLTALLVAFLILCCISSTGLLRCGSLQKTKDANLLAYAAPQSKGPAEKFKSLESLKSLKDAKSGLSNTKVLAAKTLTAKASDWLGPMAPVAMSPFFGITCLSGLACFGQDWVPANAMLGPDSPLANPAVFWVFLVLTILTSAPRFTKVSKPLAQALDFVETYSGVITLVAIRFMVSGDAGSLIPTAVQGGGIEATELVQHQAGFVSFTLDTLLTIAMAINIIVINTVKFFFEVLIWITPIPFLDACFELANKAICAALMSLYTFSPLLATILNLALFVVCFFVFRWVRRRVVFYRHMLIDSALGWIPSKSKPNAKQLVVFPVSELNAIPAKTKCWLQYDAAEGGKWTATQKRWFFEPRVVELTQNEPAKIEKGWITNAMHFNNEVELKFSRRFNDSLDELADIYAAIVAEEKQVDASSSRKVEFAG